MKIKFSQKNRAIKNAARHFPAMARTFLIRYIGIRGYVAKGLR